MIRGATKLSNSKFESEDEHFFVMKGRRWRKTDPNIPAALKDELVKSLMDARRLVKKAKATDDPVLMKLARTNVNNAKVALGERGDPWWEEPSERSRQGRIEAAYRALIYRRSGEAIDTAAVASDLAKIVCGDSWFECLDDVKITLAEVSDDHI